MINNGIIHDKSSPKTSFLFIYSILISFTLKFQEEHNVHYDYFIICEGSSTTHVQSIAESIIKNTILLNNLKPNSKEGFENKKWILLDYFNIIIHVFYKNTRKLYNIEDIWYDTILTKY